MQPFRKYLIIICLLTTFLLSSKEVLALQPRTSTPTPTPTIVPVNSYELFWPLVAGKSSGDSFYSLKILKEKVRGLLIFGKAKKADYQVFLGIKRLLEAEKLFKENKEDALNETLLTAVSEFSSASLNIDQAKKRDLLSDSVKTNIKNRLDNAVRLIDWLNDDSFTKTKQMIVELLRKVS